MAGIGFELRKVIKKRSLLSYMAMYSYAAFLSAGPWIISMAAIMAIGFIYIFGNAKHDIIHFQVIITYAFALASTLIATAFVQLPFTRYVADLLFEKRHEEVVPTFFGVLIVVWTLGLILQIPLVHFLLPDFTLEDKYLILAIFMLLDGIWIANVLASSLKLYKWLFWFYFIAYGLIVVLAYLFGHDIRDIFWIFLGGNALLLFAMIALIVAEYGFYKKISFAFFSKKHFYFYLGFAGLFYNMGTWIDKFLFWYDPKTGVDVVGRIHASVVYDIPVFVAFIAIIPGIAVFFYRLEADFAEIYDKFYQAVLHGGTLFEIENYKKEMFQVVKHSLGEILLYQLIIDLFIFLASDTIFQKLYIPKLYSVLLYVIVLGATMQLVFMAILAFLHYLDRQKEAMWLGLLFLVLNATLSYISIQLGPQFFGYGYAIAALVVTVAGVLVLQRVIQRIDFETFMYQ